MSEHIDGRKRARLSKFLTLILRHQPNLIDDEVDGEGFLSINLNELAKRISNNKQGLEWVTKEDIIDVVNTDPKGRYEIRNNLIRATYGHSLRVNPLENPDDPDLLPEFVYYAAGKDELLTMLKFGLVPRDQRDRQFLHLSVRKQDAYYVAKHHINYPKLIKINIALAHASGIRFKQVSRLIVVSDEISPQFIEEIPVPEHFKNKKFKKRFNKGKPRRTGNNKGEYQKNYHGRDHTNKQSNNKHQRQTREQQEDFDFDPNQKDDEITIRAKAKSTIHFDIDEDDDF